MRFGQCIDGETLGQVLLHPCGEFRGGFGVEGDALLEAGLGALQIGAVEDGTNVGGNNGAQVEAGNVRLSVLLEMELASLPWHRWKNGPACGGQSGMSVADDELHRMEAPLDERSEEGAPMGLGLADDPNAVEAVPRADGIAGGETRRQAGQARQRHKFATAVVKLCLD